MSIVPRFPPLACRVVHDHDGIAALRSPWQALCDRCPWATPFQRPEWLLPWMQRFGPDQPWMVTAHAGQRLVGLAPLFRYQRDDERVIAFLGAGISDYLDAVIEPGFEPRFLAALVAELGARADQWDVCELDDLLPTSALRALVPPPGWTAERTARSPCPVLPLPARVAELDRSVPRRHLKRFYQYRRRAAREGELTLERASAHTRELLLSELFRLHQARWQRRSQPGVLGDGQVRGFHRQVAAELCDRGALALYALRLRDRVIACLHAFIDKDTCYFYASGFEPDAGHLSPGVLILGMVIEDMIARGLARFDFLRGDEPYKSWWGARPRTTERLRLRRP
jgi:CelD/BcsL family acetyltransferase involved in cellulose biosynthesis